MTQKDAVALAYLAGFMASSEGYNGEQGFETQNPEENAAWCRDRDNALTALRAQPAWWLPIESAPKDGTVILLFGDERVTSGHWSAPSETPRLVYQDGFAPEPKWDDWEPYWASWDGGFTEEHPPTHWMFMPNPPKEIV